MALINGIATKLQGSAGSFTFRESKGGVVVSEKATRVNNPRTTAQQKQRMKWANTVEMYRNFSPLLKEAFENKVGRVTDYNMFVKLNMQREAVYLTRQEVENGACVVAPYVISQGSLPSIETEVSGNECVTSIDLGSLMVSATTTVRELSVAVVSNNESYEFGDQLSFFTIEQRKNGVTGVPYGVFRAKYLKLDKTNDAKLTDVVGSVGFQAKSGRLACLDTKAYAAVCWVHSRTSKKGTKVSTQILIVNNPLLASYTGNDAYKRAVATYGGEQKVFLNGNGDEQTHQESSNSSSGGSSGNQDSPTPPSGGNGDDSNLI